MKYLRLRNETAGKVCLVCGIDLPPVSVAQYQKGGRARLYCSGACRQMAYRYRADPELAETLRRLQAGEIHHPKKATDG